MTNAELASKYNLTLTELKTEFYKFIQCEGSDDAGNEYSTFDAWMNKKPDTDSHDPVCPKDMDGEEFFRYMNGE